VKKLFANPVFWRGLASVVMFLILWEIGSRSKQWMAPEFFAPLRELLGTLGFKKDYLPWIGAVPAPSAVLEAWVAVLGQGGYWQSWTMSFFRVMGGFSSGFAGAFAQNFLISHSGRRHPSRPWYGEMFIELPYCANYDNEAASDKRERLLVCSIRQPVPNTSKPVHRNHAKRC